MKYNRCLRDFVRYVSLNVLGMLGLSCYILADTFFVARGLGPNGLTALNLAIPIYNFIHGSGLMLGMGGGILYTLRKSRDDQQGANRVFTAALLLGAGLAVIFLGAGLFSGPIAGALGADETVYDMTRTYLQVILWFSPAFLLNNILLCFVRNDGAPHLSMAAMISGSMANIVLDYLFVFPLGMGIFGAAFATGLAPIISLLILSPHLLKKKELRPVRGRLSAALFGGILSGGLPSLITEASAGVVMMVFNAVILRLEGNMGVAAYGVIANLSLVVMSIYTGIAQGCQPLFSSQYGAEQYNEVRSMLRYALTTMLGISMLLYAGIFFGASPISGLFNSEQNPLFEELARTGMRLYFTACPFAGFSIILSSYFTATESARPAQVLTLLRGFLLIIPMAIVLSAVGGMLGVWLAFPLTELLVSGLGLLFYFRIVKPRSRGAK